MATQAEAKDDAGGGAAGEGAAPTAAPLRPLQAPPWVRAAFRVVSAVLPQPLTARLARKLYFTPLRARVRDEERAVLARAERTVVGEAPETAVAHAWGEGPTVLLVHGWGGHAGQMTPFVDPLVRAGYRAVAIDLPGHGQSPKVESSVVQFSRAIARIAARYAPVHGVIAHSLGAGAVTIALSHGLELERAVFFAPPARFKVFATRFQNAVGASDRLVEAMLVDADRWLRVELESLRPTTLAPAMRTPLLVLHDDADGEIPVTEGFDLVAAWPGATLERTQGRGHLRSLRDAGCVERAVRFVAGDGASKADAPKADAPKADELGRAA